MFDMIEKLYQITKRQASCLGAKVTHCNAAVNALNSFIYKWDQLKMRATFPKYLRAKVII